MIVQIQNAVSDDDCRLLTKIYDRLAPLATVKDYTGHPIVYWEQFCSAADTAEIVRCLVDEFLRSISTHLQVADPLYPETVILAALGAGGFHGRHADNCRQNEQGDWVANHTPNRDASAIYYLNEAFDGGEIVFHQQQLAVKPRCGLLVAFPSGADYTHEVLPMRSGIRYTMAIWFTKQQRLALANFPRGTSTTASDIRARGTTTA
jgi:predicted 2-oxoglutarate/Fe(II)-dependent dioxygenase YbiX